MSDLLPPDHPSTGAEPGLRVEIHSGPLAGKVYPFHTDRLTMGRAPDNDIVLEDVQVSRYHAVLRRQGREVLLQDLGSTNGTLVNGDRVYGEHVLQPTETITLGSSVLSVTGFPAPSTVSMASQIDEDNPAPWQTYQSSATPVQTVTLGGNNWLLWGGLLALLILVLAIVGAAILLLGSGRANTIDSVPVVIITSPVSGSQFRVGQRIFVQVTATDLEGITRLELWSAGQKVDEAVSPIAAGQSPFTDNLTWTPQVEGSYTLEVRAFNALDVQSAPTTVAVTVAAAADAQPTATPTVTALPDGPPSATVRTDLNVRAGPGTQYDIIGALPANVTVPVLGQTEDGSWWFIEYPSGPDRRGWIAAEFAPANTNTTVPIVNTPTPVPTETPTPTLTVTPTETPTSVPATATPTNPPPTATPTATATPDNNLTISFTAEPTTIIAGQCTTFSWKVSNVLAVYFNDDGVAGDDNGQPVVRQECPTETRTYRLRVVKLDNQEEFQDITITVVPRPEAPEDLQVVTITANSFGIEWDDNSNNEEGFRVYDADTSRLLATLSPNTSNGTLADLNCATSYRFFIVAFNQLAESTPSNIVVAQTASCP